MSTHVRLMTLATLLLVLVVGSCQNQSVAQEKKTMDGSVASLAGKHDFDFLIGSWEVSNRRLKVRHAGSAEWDEFPGRSTLRPILGGLGNVDEIDFPTKGWSGVTLRFFNPETRQWSIFWVNSRDGIMQPPVMGSFRDGVGEFYGDDIDDGRPIRVRYRWTRTAPDRPRWEQAFSLDAGNSWETNWVMELRRSAPVRLPVVELRQYTLHAGRRDTLIELFEREFVAGQEASGIRVLGRYRDIDRPNRFVWLRGFTGMEARAKALQNFYGGPIWKQHREAANATMQDCSNVLLLRPAGAGAGFVATGGLVVANMYSLNAAPADFVEFFERVALPELSKAGASVTSYFVTESAKNTFPRLPVREGESVFVWFAAFDSLKSYQLHLATLYQSREWREEIAPELRWRLKSDPEVLRLTPTTCR